MNQERIYKVLLGPHVSEKSAMSAEAGNQVVFKVLPTATKLEIKHAVEKLFKVEVDNPLFQDSSGALGKAAPSLLLSLLAVVVSVLLAVCR